MSLPIRFVPDVWDTDCQPGDATYFVGHGLGNIVPNCLQFRCPGCNAPSAANLNPPLVGASSWNWNGNRELPTLTPEIRHVCGWRGMLTGGVFIPCP